MGEKNSLLGEDFSRPAGLNSLVLWAAAKTGFIRLSEKAAEATALQALEPSQMQKIDIDQLT